MTYCSRYGYEQASSPWFSGNAVTFCNMGKTPFFYFFYFLVELSGGILV